MDTPSIRLLGISASTRPGGNTDRAFDYAARIAEENGTEFTTLHLRSYNIEPCGRCGNCNDRSSPCTQQDDIPSIIEKMTAADGIIYGVPVHAFGMAHLMQVFIERAGVGYLRFKRPLADKVGGVIVAGRRYAHHQVYSQLISNILLNRMILVGSGFPATLFAGAPGDIDSDLEGLSALQSMITRMVDMTRLMKDYQARTQHKPLPPLEENERILIENIRLSQTSTVA